MRFQIIHESRGRVRLRAVQVTMSMEQADILEAWLLALPEVDRGMVCRLGILGVEARRARSPVALEKATVNGQAFDGGLRRFVRNGADPVVDECAAFEAVAAGFLDVEHGIVSPLPAENASRETDPLRFLHRDAGAGVDRGRGVCKAIVPEKTAFQNDRNRRLCAFIHSERIPPSDGPSRAVGLHAVAPVALEPRAADRLLRTAVGLAHPDASAEIHLVAACGNVVADNQTSVDNPFV